MSLEAFLAPLRRRFPDAEPAPADLDLAWLTDAPSAAGRCRRSTSAGSPYFDARVYEAVRGSVPAGETVTYGEVAAIVGSPGAARAVGGAMSRCPLFPAVPCHRVVRASDGWSGWGGDDRLKRRLPREAAATALQLSGSARQLRGLRAMQAETAVETVRFRHVRAWPCSPCAVDGVRTARRATCAHRGAHLTLRAAGSAERVYFLTLSASAASAASGTVPPAAWARLMSDSLLPWKTSSMRP